MACWRQKRRRRGLLPNSSPRLATETGVSANARCDLYSIWAAVTALTQEIKLEGRSFKQLSETLAPLADLAPQLPEMHREAQERARREMLDVLLESAGPPGPGPRGGPREPGENARIARIRLGGRLLARHTVLAPGLGSRQPRSSEGYTLSLDRLDEVLAQFDVRKIVCQGEPFDPGSMHAVDVEETEQAAEGTVVEVYRAGYEWKGEVYRPAQVKVARRPAPTTSAGDHKNE